MAQIENRTIFSCDNLPVMRGISSESIDLIYLDPPFNSNHNYAAPLESEAAGGAFKDTWTLSDIDEDWIGLIAESYPALHSVIETAGKVNGDSHKSYMVYMTIRVMEMYRVLKPAGSIYLHCDPKMSHHLKLMMDAIFNKNNFINEIVWAYDKWTNAAESFQNNHDIIFFYSKDKKNKMFNKMRREDSPKHYDKGWHDNTIDGGIKQLIVYNKIKAKSKIDSGNYDKIIYREGEVKVALQDWWHMSVINSQAKERTGYPTQKPLNLLRRIIKASSDEGDIVLDPFCGCATTCIAAEELKRQWIGIDIDPLAAELVEERMKKELGLFSMGIKNPHKAPAPVEKLSRNIKHVLFHQQGGVCNGCHISFPIQNFHKDHIIPKSKGGADLDSNFQLLCGFCNSLKKDRTMSYLEQELKKREII